MAIPLIPLITAGSGIVSQLIQNRMNKNMANYTYSKDMAMWEKANEYNSPRNQMMRLSAAGLNPNLAYQQASTGNTTASMPKYTPPERSFKVPDTIQILNQFQDFALKTKQLDFIKEQIEKTDLTNQMQQWKNLFADPLIKYDENKEAYGLPANWNKFMLEIQADAAKLKNLKTEQEIKKVLNQVGITDQQKKWLELKYSTMLNTNVNIDKDAIWQRILADFFGPAIETFKSRLKSPVNNYLIHK